MSLLRTVMVEMYNGENVTYSNVSRIDEDNHHYKLYGVAGSLLAVLSTSDVKNLLSEDSITG